MRTKNAQKLYDKINEQKKFWEVNVEFVVTVLVRPVTIKLELEGAYETFGEETVSFNQTRVRFAGGKFFEVEANSAEEAKKKFEALNTGQGWEVNPYVGTQYISEGFEVEIEDADIKVVSVEESR